MPGSAQYQYAYEPESVAARVVANFKEWWRSFRRKRKNVRRRRNGEFEIERWNSATN